MYCSLQVITVLENVTLEPGVMAKSKRVSRALKLLPLNDPSRNRFRYDDNPCGRNTAIYVIDNLLAVDHPVSIHAC